MRRLNSVLALVFILSVPIGLYGHCQVPCGIYDDAVRIVQIEEDIATIRKAMGMIKGLSGKSDAQTMNQMIRWVNTKEEHASRIQVSVSSYFLIFEKSISCSSVMICVQISHEWTFFFM